MFASCDAFSDHAGIREVIGDRMLATIVHDLLGAIWASVNIDWTLKEAVRADMRRKLRLPLRNQRNPPDKQNKAVVVVVEQDELVFGDWAAGGR